MRSLQRPALSHLSERLRVITIAITLMNGGTLFAWWGFNLWVPAYLSLPRNLGGVGLSAHLMSGVVIAMQVGMWLGYVSFGFLSDAFGRKRCYVAYLISATLVVFFYGRVHTVPLLLLLSPIMAFFGTGYFTGFAAVTAEIYPTPIRATAQGFTYNLGRIASALARPLLLVEWPSNMVSPPPLQSLRWLSLLLRSADSGFPKPM